MGLATAGGTVKSHGVIVTAYFINTRLGTYPRNLVVSDDYFEPVQTSGNDFLATAKKTFQVTYSVTNDSVMRSAITNSSTGAQTVLTDGATYSFESGVQYRFQYTFTAVGNGMSFAVGKIV